MASINIQALEDFLREHTASFADCAEEFGCSPEKAAETYAWLKARRWFSSYFYVYQTGDRFSLIPTAHWFSDYGAFVYEGKAGILDPMTDYFGRFPKKIRQLLTLKFDAKPAGPPLRI